MLALLATQQTHKCPSEDGLFIVPGISGWKMEISFALLVVISRHYRLDGGRPRPALHNAVSLTRTVRRQFATIAIANFAESL